MKFYKNEAASACAYHCCDGYILVDVFYYHVINLKKWKFVCDISNSYRIKTRLSTSPLLC